ncbi:hypothetical protein BCD64_21350 [Nostoc sp. MBR 210]|uniref:Uncharacterized protein n=1 Tax=Nostoc spongiaeforme FACHB-130 TaxID=1357510 RepID=A0ABR8FTN9_9NOSO|nr:hypothetical protein [Nostoc spongiaeforme]MBD2594621.1 hypothetical protein [Nostoc spongiaeforme FACHB-130]OCQ97394.1 hypothetical protein BCD64_21350 [Nostoc sp. MBR 210]
MTTQFYSQLIASSLASGLIAFGYSVPGFHTATNLTNMTSTSEINHTSLNQMSASHIKSDLTVDGGFPERLVVAGSR